MALPTPLANSDAARRARLRAGAVSLVVGSGLCGLKFAGWAITGSAAILSDALESIVNVVAALFSLVSLTFASRPADRSHPYGHGKVEFLSSGFEGGLIAFAALVIVYQGVEALRTAAPLHALGEGVLLVAAAGVGNALLGAYLVRVGRRAHSPALEADGLHVLSDFWTSAGVVLGLGLVWLTGWQPFDPLVAILVGLNLGWMGAKVLRRAIGGLLDESDAELLSRLVDAFNRVENPGVIAIHRLRAIRFGGVVHVDAHLVVPRFWTVARAHDAASRFEELVVQAVGQDAEINFHLDPCMSRECGECGLDPAAPKPHDFSRPRRWTLEEITGEG